MPTTGNPRGRERNELRPGTRGPDVSSRRGDLLGFGEGQRDARHVARSTREGYQPVARLPTPPPVRRPREVVTAVLAVLALALVVLGVPAALIAFVGNPLPTGLPARDWLSEEISFTAVIRVFSVVVWIAWAHFTTCVISEWRTARAGRLPLHVPLGGASQQVARRLVAAVLLLSGAAVLVPPVSSAPPPRSDTAASATLDPSGTVEAMRGQQREGSGTERGTVSPDRPLSASPSPESTGRRPMSSDDVVLWYEVQPPRGRHYDCLWDIADRTLGDPLRYKEIFSLNRDRVQTDGRRLVDADLIHPGWMLLMPPDAKGPGITATNPVRLSPTRPSRSTERADPAGGHPGMVMPDAALPGAGSAVQGSGAQGAAEQGAAVQGSGAQGTGVAIGEALAAPVEDGQTTGGDQLEAAREDVERDTSALLGAGSTGNVDGPGGAPSDPGGGPGSGPGDGPGDGPGGGLEGPGGPGTELTDDPGARPGGGVEVSDTGAALWGAVPEGEGLPPAAVLPDELSPIAEAVAQSLHDSASLRPAEPLVTAPGPAQAPAPEPAEPPAPEPTQPSVPAPAQMSAPVPARPPVPAEPPLPAPAERSAPDLTQAPAPARAQPPVPAEPPLPAPVQTSAPAPAAEVSALGEETASMDLPGLGRGMLGGGLLLAGVLVALSARRGPFGAPDEQAAPLRLAADPDRASLLDHALRVLAATCTSRGVPLPEVLVAQVSCDEVVLHLASGAFATRRGLAPWHISEDGRRWMLHAAALDAHLQQLQRERHLSTPVLSAPAPYPGLVNVARVGDDEILVDLEAAPGITSLCGDAGCAREVAASLAVELVTNPWSDGVQVTLVGFGEDLADIAPDLMRHADRLDQVLDGVEQQSRQRREMLTRLGLSGVLSGRTSRAARTLRPHVLLLSGPPTPDEARRLHELVSHGRTPLAVLCLGDVPAARWRLVVAADGAMELALLGVQGRARRLSRTEYRSLLTLFRSAEQRRADGADRAARQSPRCAALSALGAGEDPDPDSPVAQRAVTGVQVPLFGMNGALVAVRLLGPVRVDHHSSILGTIRPVDPASIPLLTEIVVAAALHRSGLHEAVLRAAVWPRGVGDDVLRRAVREVQDWLGYDGLGNPRFRQRADGRWVLTGDVVCDWDVFRAVLATTPGEHEGAALHEALSLARGEVFSGVPPTRYSWLTFHAAARDARIVATTVALRAARMSVRAGRDADGVGALNRGLMLVPTSEVLWRELLGHIAADGPHALDRAVQRMDEELRARGIRPEPETDALVDSLLPGYRNRSA